MGSAADNFITEEVIKRRLLIDGDGVGDDRRILSLMKAYIHLAVGNLSPEERETHHRRLICQLLQTSSSFLRSQSMISVNEGTRDDFAALGRELSGEVAATKAHISTCKTLLEAATKHRKHAQEYDALGKLIQAQPDRRETEAKKAALTKELTILKAKEGTLRQQLNSRKQNISILSASIERLRELLSRDLDEDEELHSMETDAKATVSTTTANSEAATQKIVLDEMETEPMDVDEGTKPKGDKYHEDLSDDESESQS